MNLELKQYLKILKNYIFFIILFAFGGAILAFIFTQKLKSGVSFEQYFYLSFPQTSDSVYYSQETARNFTDTAIAILSSPDFIRENISSDKQLAVRKIAPQVIKLTATAKDHETAKSAIDNAVLGFNQKITQLLGDQTISIKAIGKAGSAISPIPNQPLILVFGIFSGAIFALFIIGLKIYFKV